MHIAFASCLSSFCLFSHLMLNCSFPCCNEKKAIDETLFIGLPADNPVALAQMAAGFAKCSKGHMTNCVSAIDGWVMRTRKPRASEVDNIMGYRNRHDCWGIVIIAGCDSTTRFNMWSCQSTGSTCDCLAWDFCQFKKDLEEGMLPREYYVIGDEAFTNTYQFLVPWAGRGLKDGKDAFNYHLSAMRQCIERAFGILTERWGIFWRPVRCAFNKWTMLARTCAKLHNFCLDQNDDKPSYRLFKDMRHLDQPVVLFNGNNATAPRRGPGSGDKRIDLTNYFNLRGITRPLHANTRKQ